MMLSWNGSLYIRKNKPPKYLQKLLLKNEYKNPRRQLKQYYSILSVQVANKTLGIFS
jgi:hypothetical protein